jgi:NAD(P)-dependent dehydrogenase (short-subunit alcohol dehydrogenase family)
VNQVNLKGAFLCCKAVYPQMKKQRKGKIVNVSSGTFFKGIPLFIVTSKGGIVAFTRALTRELGDDGICVNTIAPGYTITDVMREKPMFNEEFHRAIINSRCFKQEEQPQDLTGTV